jgi:hypothetical protein
MITDCKFILYGPDVPFCRKNERWSGINEVWEENLNPYMENIVFVINKLIRLLELMGLLPA